MDERNRGAGMRARGGRAVAIALLLVFLAGLGVAVAAYYLNSAPTENLGAPVPVTIARGESLRVIALRLQRLGVIRSARMLGAIARLERTATLVQSGHYLFTEPMSAREMHDYLLSGNQVLVRVTIPEGLTVSRIAGFFEEAGVTNVAAFERAAHDRDILASFGLPGESAEGFLFPDTYLFTSDYPAEEVVRHMMSRFMEVLAGVYPDYGTLSASELYRRVIVASIVEREYRIPDEAPIIASVFYNRLDSHMRLESCASVVYVMTEIEGLPHPQRLFYRDLDRANPYNTYFAAGLPPGPISNPGRNALEAAFFPATTDYLFFVWNGPGSDSHVFTRTFSEHTEAKLLYLKSP